MNTVFWEVTSCNFMDRYPHFGASGCLQQYSSMFGWFCWLIQLATDTAATDTAATDTGNTTTAGRSNNKMLNTQSTPDVVFIRVGNMSVFVSILVVPSSLIYLLISLISI
jgi:hypothetical protein